MRFCRVCAVQFVIPNGVVTSGIVPPYSGPLPEPPVPMYVFTQSTGVSLTAPVACAVAAQIERNDSTAALTPICSDSKVLPQLWCSVGEIGLRVFRAYRGAVGCTLRHARRSCRDEEKPDRSATCSISS